jgi:fatty-acyl-CoA synthase
MDGDNDLYIVERKKDMYISGGENVYPAEVENILYEIQEIAETAVIGVADEKWGETGLAVVVLKPGTEISEAGILGYLGKKLAKFKIPKKFVFLNQLPRNAAGKVLKNELKKQFS